MTIERVDVAIVGAGLAGLACARDLRIARPELSVVVLEASGRAGGLVETVRVDGFLGEAGPNAFLDGPAGAGRLARELEIPLLDAPPVSRRRWVWKDGALVLVPASPPALLKTGLLPLRAKARVLAETFVRSRTHPGESVTAFLTRRFGADAAALVGPALVRGVYAGDPAALELASCFPSIARLEAEHGSLLTGMARVARSGGFGLRSAAPVGGVGELVRALEAAVGDALRPGRRVVTISRRGGSSSSAGRGAEGPLNDGFALGLTDHGALVAREVALCLPPDAAAPLCTPLDPGLGASLAAIPVAGAAVVWVGAARSEVAHPLDGFGFLTLPPGRRDGTPVRLVGAVFESSLWPGRAPEGHVLVRAIYGGTIDPEIVAWDEERLGQQACADLARTIGLGRAALVRAIRWPHALPQPVIGHAARLDAIETAARTLGVVLAGSGYRAVGVNAAIDSGRHAATLLGVRRGVSGAT